MEERIAQVFREIEASANAVIARVALRKPAVLRPATDMRHSPPASVRPVAEGAPSSAAEKKAELLAVVRQIEADRPQRQPEPPARSAARVGLFRRLRDLLVDMTGIGRGRG